MPVGHGSLASLLKVLKVMAMSSNEMTVEQARAKLGDLVIKAMLGESTIITRYGKPVAQITPYAPERTMTVLSLDEIVQFVTSSVTANGEELAEGIDIEAAAKELRDVYEIDTRQDLEDLDHDTYWAIIRKHDATQQA
jgi:prevent-host-death family protein